MKNIILVIAGTAFLSACGGGGGTGLSSVTTTDSTSNDTDLMFVSLTAPAGINVTDNSDLGVSFSIKNSGSTRVAPSLGIMTAFYLSEDNNITTDDIYIGFTGTLVKLLNGLAPGETFSDSIDLRLPRNLPNGNFYIGGIVDPRTYTYDHLMAAIRNDAQTTETDEENNFSEAYAFTVSGSESCLDDYFEPDDIYTQATQLMLGVPQNHNFCFDSSDWFKFDAVAGNMYVINTNTGSSGDRADTYLSLYAENGETLILKNDNETASNRDAKLVWTADTSGTFYVKASTHDHQNFSTNYGPGLETEYTITLE